MNPRPRFSTLAKWLPSPGSVLFTLIVAVGLLVYAHRAGAFPASQTRTPSASSISTLPYQGRLTDMDGSPVNGTEDMIFRLYAIPSGGTALWEETWPDVPVSEGLFNVLLGSTTPIPQNVISENTSLWLGVTVSTDTEMAPRVQVGSVPFTFQANRAYGLAATDGDPQDAVFVDANGNVGIGTTNPSGAIHIVGGNGNSTPNFAGIQLGYDGANYGIEITNDGGSPYIDFQNDILGIDYDARIRLLHC